MRHALGVRLAGLLLTAAIALAMEAMPIAAIESASSSGLDALEVTLEFDAGKIRVATRDGATDIWFPSGEMLASPGAPAVPSEIALIALPAGTRAQSIEVASVASERRRLSHPLRPAQPPAILGPIGVDVAAPRIVPPDPAFYEAGGLYPDAIAELVGTGSLSGLPLAECRVHPIRYDPASQELLLHTRIVLRIALAPDPGAAGWTPAPGRALDRELWTIAKQRLHGALDGVPAPANGVALALDPGDYQYVIVTHAAQLAAWQPYAAWKTAKGLPATVVTTDEIAQGYGGRDLAERIRNFIRDARDTWGTSYVLLAGDDPLVPERAAWAFDCEAGAYPDENDIPADLYYSDLDGSWDANGNGVFGEVDDDVDLYPDVLVGRIPTMGANDAAAVVQKLLTYERTPASGYVRDAFFFAEILWSNPYTDAGVGKDMLAEAHFASYEPILRRYESLANLSPQSVCDAFNSGVHFTNHGGHASWSVLGAGTGNLTKDNVDALVNAPRYFVLYSIGCWAGAFDYDCIAEHFVRNSHGGAIAFVGNSRYGWGSPGNPGWGYSETFDRDFYGVIAGEAGSPLGFSVAWPKILRIPFSRDENVYRWHQYQVNLLGDPEMVAHTSEIQALVLEAPAVVPTGTPAITAVLDDANGPVEGARLCLTGTGVYHIGYTDALGRVVFTPDLPSAQALTLTATAVNHTFAQRTIVATGEGAFLTVSSTEIDDDAVAPSAGNGDGEIGSGETIELSVTIANQGNAASTGVAGTLTSSSAWISLSQAQASFGDVAAGGSATGDAPFVFAVDGACPPAEPLSLTLALTDGEGGSWQVPVPLRVVAPGPRFHHYVATEAMGDGDGLIEPGERAELSIWIENAGTGNLGPVTATLGTTDPHMIVLQGASGTSGGVPPGGLVLLAPPFVVEVAPGAPPTGYISMTLDIAHGEGAAVDRFLFAVGEVRFDDDMESGQGGWTHAGTLDRWHLSQERAHSGATSWYCGASDTHQYLNGMDAALVSPEIVTPENGQLSFWCYFDVTTYGTDGLSIEVFDGLGWRRIGYLGSGGALGTLFTCDWAPQVYDLTGLSPGQPTQIAFRFESDGIDTAEGFYVDDVVVAPQLMIAVDSGPGTRALPLLVPFSGRPVTGPARWLLTLRALEPVTADVHDSRGRRIRSLFGGKLGAGRHEIVWDGRTTTGADAPAGVYFLNLRAGRDRVTDKIVRFGR